jgi:hypothetical protein
MTRIFPPIAGNASEFLVGFAVPVGSCGVWVQKIAAMIASYIRQH